MDDLDAVKVDNLNKLKELSPDRGSRTVLFENNNPQSWVALRSIRESGGSYKRLGFKTWQISLPHLKFVVSNERHIRKRIVIARAAVFLVFVLICVFELSGQLTPYVKNWPKLENVLKDYPFLSSILSGAILALPFGVFYKWTAKATKEYLGLN